MTIEEIEKAWEHKAKFSIHDWGELGVWAMRFGPRLIAVAKAAKKMDDGYDGCCCRDCQPEFYKALDELEK